LESRILKFFYKRIGYYLTIKILQIVPNVMVLKHWLKKKNVKAATVRDVWKLNTATCVKKIVKKHFNPLGKIMRFSPLLIFNRCHSNL